MKNCKVFIVEGEAREVEIIEKIKEIFFKNTKFEIITLPAGQNVYMLWKKMKEDDFETDIIEVLRESNEKIRKSIEGYSRNDFSEVYLFFDYDAHQRNMIKEADEGIIEEMLQSFSNETENGKLYISYPMVEALRDFNEGDEKNRSEWFYEMADYAEYKNFSARRKCNIDVRKYSFEIWKLIMREFIAKVSFLCSKEGEIDYKEYRDRVTPELIYLKEKEFREKVLILSAFPEFLLDYFTERLWKCCVKKGFK